LKRIVNLSELENTMHAEEWLYEELAGKGLSGKELDNIIETHKRKLGITFIDDRDLEYINNTPDAQLRMQAITMNYLADLEKKENI